MSLQHTEVGLGEGQKPSGQAPARAHCSFWWGQRADARLLNAQSALDVRR